MNRIYLSLALLVLVAGAGLLLVPLEEKREEAEAGQLLQDLRDASRFVSTDAVARRIIEQDPALLLVDLRPEKEFNAFHLPAAINIPFENLMEEDALDILADDRREIVLVSQRDVLSEEAWLLLRRMRMKHIYIMRGGLHSWAETILRPPVPPESCPEEVRRRYQARLGAQQFFTGVNAVQEKKEINSPEVVIPQRKSRQTTLEGGC